MRQLGVWLTIAILLSVCAASQQAFLDNPTAISNVQVCRNYLRDKDDLSQPIAHDDRSDDVRYQAALAGELMRRSLSYNQCETIVADDNARIATILAATLAVAAVAAAAADGGGGGSGYGDSGYVLWYQSGTGANWIRRQSFYDRRQCLDFGNTYGDTFYDWQCRPANSAAPSSGSYSLWYQSGVGASWYKISTHPSRRSCVDMALRSNYYDWDCRPY